jgi:hypothetical protein
MIILDISCTNPSECHEKIKEKIPNVVNISHIKNNHIVTIDKDHNSKGDMDNDIHKLCWQLGGVIKKEKLPKQKFKILKSPDIKTNKFYKKVLEKKKLKEL